MIIKPTLLVGLGQAGITVSKTSRDQFVSTYPDFSKLVEVVTLDEDGTLSSVSSSKSIFQNIFHEDAKNPYHDNYHAIAEKEASIYEFLDSNYNDLRNLAHDLALLKKGVDLGEYQVIIVASLYEKVGSISILPFLRIIDRFRSDKAIRNLESHCVGILPDMEGEKSQGADGGTSAGNMKVIESYSRTYAALSEIDGVLSDPGHSRLTTSFFLVSNKNMSNIAVGSLEEVTTTIALYCDMLIRDELTALFGSTHLFTPIQGKGPYYGSFGLSSLTYPAKKFVDALKATSIKEVLDTLVERIQKKQNRNEINSVIIDFLSGYDDEKLLGAITQKVDHGEEIYTDFDRYLGQKYQHEDLLEETNIDKYVEDVNAKSKEYSDHLLNGQYIPALTQRKDDLTKSFIDNIDKKHLGFIEDESGKQGVTYAHGFLSLLRRSESKYLDGDVLGETRDLISLEEKELAFYKSKVEDDTKDVKRVEELETQIKNKETQLKRLKEDLEGEEKKLAGGEPVEFEIIGGKFFNIEGKKVHVNGYKPDDKKDGLKTYEYNTIPPDKMPGMVDLRPFLTPVEDQGEIGSCTANAIAGAYEFLAKRNTGKQIDMSRLFIYYNARAVAGTVQEDCGSSLGDCAKALQDKGACFEQTWPYDSSKVLDQPSPAAYDEASKFKVDDASRIPIDLQAMKHCLAEGYPFAFGLKVSAAFMDRKNVRIPVPQLNEMNDGKCGNHAMLCVGYSEKDRMFIVRNSWGEEWKDKGYCYVPYEYMTNQDYCLDSVQIRSVDDKSEIDRKLIWKGEGSLFDEVVNDAKLESLKQAIKKAEDELSGIVEEYTPIKQKVEALNNQVRDANFRHDLTEKEVESKDEEIAKTRKELTANEEELNKTNHRLDDLLALKDKWIKRLLIYGPSIIVGVILLILVLAGHFTSLGTVLGFLFDYTGDAIILLAVIAAVYSIWGWKKYKNVVGDELKQTQISLKDLKNKKVNLLLQFNHQNSDKYTIRFHHAVHSYLIDLVRDVEKWIDEKLEVLDKFISSLLELRNREVEFLKDMRFEESIFLNSVVSKEDLQTFKAKGDLFDEFFSARGRGPFVSYYTNYLESKNIEVIEKNLDGFFDEKYSILKGKSIYDMIFREKTIVEKFPAETRIKLLINAARPYVHVSAVGEAGADTFSLHRWKSDSDEGTLTDLFTKNGVKFSQTIDSDDRETVTLLSVKNGIPAFYSSCLLECYSVYQQALKAGRSPDEFFSDPDYVNRSFIPFAVIYRNREVLTTLLQACAMGVVQIEDDGFHTKTERIGTSLYDSYEFLNSLQGEQELKQLQEAVSADRFQSMTKEERGKISGMIGEFRRKYSNTLLSDKTAQDIVDRLLRSLA